MNLVESFLAYLMSQIHQNRFQQDHCFLIISTSISTAITLKVDFDFEIIERTSRLAYTTFD